MPPSNGKSLLILDDEVAYLEFLGTLMSEHLTCPVVTFSRPLPALEALAHLDVGLIATDYYMPQINGIEFMRRARKVSPGTPYLVITAHGMELESGGLANIPELRHVLHKPFKWQDLATHVIKHWNGDLVPTIR